MSNGDAALAGGCACGSVRYRLRRRPMFVNCCHCSECQRQLGSAFAVNAVIETEAIEVLAGTPEPLTVPTASGRPHDIYRCRACQSPLWSDYGRRPGLRFVRVCTLDEPGALPPGAHIFTSTKLPWLVLPPDVPAFTEFYELERMWPAESMARRRAVEAK